jgi:hypothetical protein
MRYTDKQIQRLIDSWLGLGTDDRTRSMSLPELQAKIHVCECCGDATEECGDRAAEYKAAREQGMENLRALLRARIAEA